MGGADEFWIRSTRCMSGDCVEVLLSEERVAMRDSAAAETGSLVFSAASWSSFLSAIRAGEFDWPEPSPGRAA